ncbi:unnamed protein product, partial [Mesorhabditis belari]|uniref:PDZ domain-containing protein n=1 Tax=Mesorhabditis belari TaxID=2138241 RepID=A0AAF3F8C6_9BILA
MSVGNEEKARSGSRAAQWVQIEIGKKTLVEVAKIDKPLGLMVIGGVDTPLGAVVIHDVFPDGAAALDGRLRPGDQVLEVNGLSLRGVTQEWADSFLRRTPAKFNVRLLIYRQANLQDALGDPAQVYDICEVKLVKKRGKGLGLMISGRICGSGVYVSKVFKGGTAGASRRVFIGDQILAVNWNDVAAHTQEELAIILKVFVGKLTVKLGRWKIAETVDKI